MKTCPEPNKWVLFAAGELDGPESAALTAHLATCPACREEVAAVARGLRALESMDSGPAMRPAAVEALRVRLAETRPVPQARPRRVIRLARWGAVAAAAAAAVIIAVTVSSLMRPGTDVATASPRLMDDLQVVQEMAEITAQIEMLEGADFASAAEGNGTNHRRNGMEETEEGFDMFLYWLELDRQG